MVGIDLIAPSKNIEQIKSHSNLKYEIGTQKAQEISWVNKIILDTKIVF